MKNNWKFYKLGELIEYKKGYAFKSTDYQDTGVRIIRVSDTTYNSIKDQDSIFISKEKASLYSNHELLENDLIVSTVGSRPPLYDSMVGKVIKVPKFYEGTLLNQNAVRLRSKASVNQFFLYSNLKTRRYVYHIESSIRGNANQASITLEDLFSFEIQLPPKKEQDKIASILSAWDEAIELKENLIEQKKEWKKGLIQKLLTGKVRLPEFNESWRTYKLYELVEFKKGKGLSKDKVSNRGKYKCILYGELYTKYNEVIGTINSYVDEKDGIVSEENDVLIPASTTTNALDLATASAVKDKGIFLGGDINILRQKKGVYINEFLAYYLKHIKKKEMAAIGQGTTIIHLYGKDLKNIEIRLPSVGEQKAIATILSKADQEIGFLQEQLLNIKEQKKGLLQLLLTGEVQVNV
ncbi:restriction endonuclease subunit S [Terribacillus saccharophilus]|uniref:restriction endonuclease subunit S n=1 Tax=Terribacillus saccharophilus TaxID=361277 RepID=UPI002989F032|nr:restriction endonuclease subunit S [Terribacillus saccharophilus]MCM3225755.1 restriction endonuclease subunit S [Terribacillus saccharophilus]